jgi:hypothetical protein
METTAVRIEPDVSEQQESRGQLSVPARAEGCAGPRDGLKSGISFAVPPSSGT